MIRFKSKYYLYQLVLLISLFITGINVATSQERQDMDQLLQSSWNEYKSTFIQNDGRVIDHRENITTSEGQSYAMLRALWMRDKATFDKTYQWAKDNLQVRKDKLFAWKWGQREDHTWGPMDNISAADADQDIALALILAHEVWPIKSETDPVYLDEARLILTDIWDKLTLEMPLGRVLLPGDWPPETHKNDIYQINLSYFAPYAYRLFAIADPDHDWDLLIDSSYEILARSVSQTTTNLPPDWVSVSMHHDEIKLYQEPKDARSDYGYEAIRAYWRIALDALLQPGEKRASRILVTSNPLPRYWKIHDDLPGTLTWDGIPRKLEVVSAASYGASLPSLYFQDPQLARDIVTTKIIPNLKPGGQWNTRSDYYSQNWLWFGLAMYSLYTDPPVVTGQPSAKKLAKLLLLQSDPL